MSRHNGSVSDTTTKAVPADSTTARVSEVLLAFAGSTGPLGVTDIARTTGLSKAVVHRIVQSLCTSDFLWQDPESRKYQVGMSAFALADTAIQSSRFRRFGLELLADLAERTDETATLSARIGHRRVYVGQVESRQLVRISVQVGEALPLAVGASGAAILAFLPESEIEAALRVPVPHLSAYTVTEPEVIRERLARVVELGYAHTASERVPDSTSFAAPVRDRAGDVIGCVSIAALVSRIDEKREQELAREVMAAAAQLTERMRNEGR